MLTMCQGNNNHLSYCHFTSYAILPNLCVSIYISTLLYRCYCRLLNHIHICVIYFMFLLDIRNNYAIIYDMIIKNIDKLHMKESTEDIMQTMY